MAKNHIKVDDETWRQLNARKDPGDTFEDVIRRLLDDEADGTAEIAAEP